MSLCFLWRNHTSIHWIFWWFLWMLSKGKQRMTHVSWVEISGNFLRLKKKFHLFNILLSQRKFSFYQKINSQTKHLSLQSSFLSFLLLNFKNFLFFFVHPMRPQMKELNIGTAKKPKFSWWFFFFFSSAVTVSW